MNLKITYKQLREELERNGWKAESIETDSFGVKRNSTVFQNPESDLYIILPKMKANQIVEPFHLLQVRNVLENSGFWDSLIREIGTNNDQKTTDVIQSLVGIKACKTG
jgi:hypothetical protein